MHIGPFSTDFLHSERRLMTCADLRCSHGAKPVDRSSLPGDPPEIGVCPFDQIDKRRLVCRFRGSGLRVGFALISHHERNSMREVGIVGRVVGGLGVIGQIVVPC